MVRKPTRDRFYDFYRTSIIRQSASNTSSFFFGVSKSSSAVPFQSQKKARPRGATLHMTPSVLAGHKDDKRRLLFSPACLASPAPLTRARSSVDARQRKITNTQIMSCVSATSAVARIAPTARLANKRAANVPPMRAARVNVVAAVDLNGASLLRSAGREHGAIAARARSAAFPDRRGLEARARAPRRAARASPAFARGVVGKNDLVPQRVPRGARCGKKATRGVLARVFFARRAALPFPRAPTVTRADRDLPHLT